MESYVVPGRMHLRNRDAANENGVIRQDLTLWTRDIVTAKRVRRGLTGNKGRTFCTKWIQDFTWVLIKENQAMPGGTEVFDPQVICKDCNVFYAANPNVKWRKQNRFAITKVSVMKLND